jgi:hypothetical protein
MTDEKEAEIQKEIVERVMAEEKKKLAASDTEDTLDTLEQMTSLPRGKLEEIAQDVRSKAAAKSDSFFSVKMQVVWVAAFIAAIVGLYYVLKWVF